MIVYSSFLLESFVLALLGEASQSLFGVLNVFELEPVSIGSVITGFVPPRKKPSNSPTQRRCTWHREIAASKTLASLIFLENRAAFLCSNRYPVACAVI
jgi:hypothetical protein